MNAWISSINSIDNTYLLDKHNLIAFLELCNSKYLTIQHIDLQNKIKNILNKGDYIIIWDCEFQIFKSSPNNLLCDSIQFENFTGGKFIRCISEIGGVVLLNINDKIYLGALFHCSFLNNRLNNKLNEYIPFYHEYLSVNKQTEKMIIDIEQNIYPHQIFNNIWSNFIKDTDTKKFTKDIIKLLNNKIIRSDKSIFYKIKDQINQLANLLSETNDVNDDHILRLIIKINTNLRSIIYTKPIKNYNKDYQFKLLYDLYINDEYIKKITVPINNQNTLIHIFLNLCIADNCINIIKGTEDLKALNNHNMVLNGCKKIERFKNVIDIADYNANIFKECGSAKLYESYVCLMDKRHQQIKKYHEKTDKKLKDFIGNFKAHNPLVDAYYTLYVFIQYNLLY